MIYSKSENAAKYVRNFREYLGLPRTEFAKWLSFYNVIGRNEEPYSVKTIESWEMGKRSVPQKVVRTIEKYLETEGIVCNTNLMKYTDDELLADVKDKNENRNKYFSQVFSQKLKAWCEYEGKKQEDFAEKIGVHANMIARYKKGDAYPSNAKLEKICDILSCSKSEFIPEFRTEKTLADYTTDELLAEIKRRIEK